MAKKTFTKTQLANLSPAEINQKIISENYSLLKTLGAEKMRRNMVPIGKLCHFVATYFYRTTGPKADEATRLKNTRQKILKKLRTLAPAKYRKSHFPKTSNHGLVIGFNHPSLGEILRLVALKLDLMGDKPMFFPVNLPWYEAIAPDYDLLKKLGVIITPTITPATWEKLALKPNTKIYQQASHIKRGFRELYTKSSADIVKSGGVIFVAPAATRQTTVFKNQVVYEKTADIIPTMSVLALKLLKDPDLNCDFLPLAVLPPKNANRNLNLFKTYQLLPGQPISADHIRSKYFKAKNPQKLDGFDYDFHQQIAHQLPKKFWY